MMFKRFAMVLLALMCVSATAQAKSLKDYRLNGIDGYSRCSFLAGGDVMLATSGMETEMRFSRRASDGSVRYELSVPMMGTQRGTMSTSLPDGRYAAAFRVDDETDEVRLFDEAGECASFRLPTDADYVRMEQAYIALLYRDAHQVKLIDYAGKEALTLQLPQDRVPLSVEVHAGNEGLFVLARTRAQEEENGMDAPYLLCRYDKSGSMTWSMLLLEEKLGCYLYGDKAMDAQDGLVIVGADKADYKKAHVLRMDAAGNTTFHTVLSDASCAVTSIDRVRCVEGQTQLYGTVVAQSRKLFTCMQLGIDSAGQLTNTDIREFDLTKDYVYGVSVSPDGDAYAVKFETKKNSIDYTWLSAVPFADLPITDKANLRVEAWE